MSYVRMTPEDVRKRAYAMLERIKASRAKELKASVDIERHIRAESTWLSRLLFSISAPSDISDEALLDELDAREDLFYLSPRRAAAALHRDQELRCLAILRMVDAASADDKLYVSADDLSAIGVAGEP